MLERCQSRAELQDTAYKAVPAVWIAAVHRTVLSVGVLRHIIHFFSYHRILGRRITRVVRAAVSIDRTADRVPPRYFISSECFAQLIDSLDLRGKQVIDVGKDPAFSRGSGTCQRPKSLCGRINPMPRSMPPRTAEPMDLAPRHRREPAFRACTRPLFDVILSSPPKHAGETAQSRPIVAWHAGPAYRDIAALFDQAGALKPGGRLYVMVSSDSDLDLFSRLIVAAGFRARLAHEHSILIESLIIYELLAG